MRNKLSVLVVEDDRSWHLNFQDWIEELFGKNEYYLEIVTNKDDALKTLGMRFFHIVIVDIELSGEEGNQDGLEVIERIWGINEGTRWLVASGKLEVSMFDDFQRMGMFSYKESPNEAREQYKLIEHYTGVVSKGGGKSSHIKQLIKEAADVAWQEYEKQKWTISPFSIIKGYSAQQVQRELKAGQIQDIRPFLSQLVRPLFPWLLSIRDTKDSIVIQGDNGEVIAYEIICWSRSLGKPVAVRLGTQKNYQHSLDQRPIAEEYFPSGIEEMYASPANGNPSSFRGAVYQLSGIDFDQFFSPPPIKRESKKKE